MFAHVNAKRKFGRYGWQIGRVRTSRGYVWITKENIGEMPHTSEEGAGRKR
jgi:hypothetical protein